MAEIKSAIELAMERTKSLVMDDGEKRALVRKEKEGKIRGLIRRYKDGYIEGGDLEKELDAIPGSEKGKKSILIDLIVEELDFRGNDERILSLLQIAGSYLPDTLREELNSLKLRYAEELERKELVIRERIRSKLKDKQISGDSLEINLEAWDEWKEGLEETQAVFQKRLREWKKKLPAPEDS